MATLSKDEWVKAGLQVLKDKGSGELSIVKLSHCLGVTRGAFYHHFKSLNELIDALIEAWEEKVVNKGFQQALTNSSDPRAEVKNLINYVTELTDRLDLVFRQWAPHNDRVRKHMERLDKKRLKTLTELFKRLAGDEVKGASLAKIAFYGYIGCLHSYPVPSAKQQRETALEVFELLVGFLDSPR